MCTGRVDLSFVVRAFQGGADGVIVGGCWPGDCHYVTEGNYDALGNVHLGKRLLSHIGVRPERLRIEWIAASEGNRFAEIMTDFTNEVTALGPLGRGEGIAEADLRARLDNVANLVPYIKLVQREKLSPPTRKEKEINAFFESEAATRAFDELIADKLTPAVQPPVASSPCQLGCPIGTQAWRYVAHIERGEYEQAYFAIREANPFPSVCSRVCDHRCERACRLGVSGEAPVAIRSLKRFITDNIDPSVYQPVRVSEAKPQTIAVVGAGPSGLTAAHQLSLRGYKVTLFEANEKAGGMLRLAIPAYRLPREVVDREIAALMNDNITMRLGVALGRDITVDSLFADGFDAVYLALGSMKSMPMRIEGEKAQGVYPSLKFLGEFNLNGVSLAKGKVGVIGGGNSAIDAARIAVRQPGVEQVTIIYRRTREEMPAFKEEIDAAIDEGVVLKTLLTPVGVETADGAIVGLKCQKNELGAPDASGRRRPVPVANSEHVIPLDTLIVAVGEKPDLDHVRAGSNGESALETTSWGSLSVDPRTLTTARKGLFAGGDLATGPSTVVDAIAAGKKAALAIDRYLSGEEMIQPGDGARAGRYVDPNPPREFPVEAWKAARLHVPHISITDRRTTYAEVEGVVTEEVARREARRCLRCDLELNRTTAPEMATCHGGGGCS